MDVEHKYLTVLPYLSVIGPRGISPTVGSGGGGVECSWGCGFTCSLHIISNYIVRMNPTPSSATLYEKKVSCYS